MKLVQLTTPSDEQSRVVTTYGSHQPSVLVNPDNVMLVTENMVTGPPMQTKTWIVMRDGRQFGVIEDVLEVRHRLES